MQFAKEAARVRQLEAIKINSSGHDRNDEIEWARKSENLSRLRAALDMSRTEQGLSDNGEGWDSDPWLLGVQNGVLDLRTGLLRDGKPEDKITRVASVVFDPTAACPTFEAFIERVQPDPAMREYLRRRAGYALTGDVGLQDMLLFIGKGANGKTTFVNALMDTMGGDLAVQAAPDLLLSHFGDRHPTEITDIDGARLVVSSEVDAGRSLSEALVKQLTGGDKLKARKMHKDFYEFEPTFKLVLLANHKPSVRGTDLGLWRRLKLVPWDVVIPVDDRDPSLRAKLKTEAAGILNWALVGCLDWQANYMKEPPSVAAATKTYRDESDTVGEFIREKCLVGDKYKAVANELFKAYGVWAEEQGYNEHDPSRLNRTRFGARIAQEYERTHTNSYNLYQGIGLQDDYDGDLPSFDEEVDNAVMSGRDDSVRKDDGLSPTNEGTCVAADNLLDGAVDDLCAIDGCNAPFDVPDAGGALLCLEHARGLTPELLRIEELLLTKGVAGLPRRSQAT